MGALDRYHLLGRTGLRVSPLGLGTMTFGPKDWGADEDTARQIFGRYLDAGGNFVDTANRYGLGRSEELVGQFIHETRSRDRVVLATKYSTPTEPGNPNAFGNGRKNMLAALDASLRRLRTDYVDLYWMHMWDTVTPVEEVMSTFDALVRSGKVRAVGLSDVPAWYATRAQMLTTMRGWEPVAALQLEYSLVERHIEREQIPACLELGTGLVAWSPLAGGLLTGKYTRAGHGMAGMAMAGDGRLTVPRIAQQPWLRPYADADWRIVDAVAATAARIGRTPAQVALRWVSARPGVAATLVGARTPTQLDDNLAALDVELPAEDQVLLDELSRPPLYMPYSIFDPTVAAQMFTPGFETRPAAGR